MRRDELLLKLGKLFSISSYCCELRLQAERTADCQEQFPKELHWTFCILEKAIGTCTP